MGLGPPVLALYHQLKGVGVFDDVKDVMELGAQNVWCPKPELVKNLFKAFKKEPPSAAMLDSFANWKGSGQALYTALGFNYSCTDVDPQFNSIPLDLNFDEVPAAHRGKYDFVTNHGTSEHILNQYNVFKAIHDFTRVNGYMLHAVPFTVHVDHGFFNYQPNFFEALAKYNSYEVSGIWVGPDWQIASFIPWEPKLLDFLVLNSKTTHLLVALLRKKFDTPFQVPFQGVYENVTPDEIMQRYNIVVDGDLYDAKQLRYITKEKIVSDAVNQQTSVLNTQIVALQSEVGRLQGEIGNLNQLGQKYASQSRADQLDNFSGRELLTMLVKRIKRRLAG